ncbi:MAG: HAD family hydrolase [Candidatus Lokiarchaeota archaeon]|nr:HAD family hydrolase [Candidatus Lokiarchaeota archaeon]
MDKKLRYFVNAIVFDYDGTLCEFQIPFLKMRRELIDFLISNFKISNDYLLIEDRISIIGKKTRKFLEDNNRIHEWEHVKEEMEKIVKRWEWQSAKKNEIYPYVSDLLNFFKNLNIKMGIFTLEPREIIDFLLEKHNIKSFFKSIIARDDVINPKPHSEHLMKVLEELESDPKHTLVVGDHPIDIECANTIGAISVAVLNKRHDKKDYNGFKVDYFLNNLSELKELFERKSEGMKI